MSTLYFREFGIRYSLPHRNFEEQPNKKPKNKSAVAILKDVRQLGCVADCHAPDDHSNAFALAQACEKSTSRHTCVHDNESYPTWWLRSRERISERVDEQVVDQSRLETARADVAEAEKNLATQVASDRR